MSWVTDSTINTGLRGEVQEDATPEQLEAAAARMIAQAANIRAAAALEPQSAGTVIRWNTQFATSSKQGVDVKTLTFVAVKANGKWWTTRRNENSHGVPWSWLVKNYAEIREGRFERAVMWDCSST